MKGRATLLASALLLLRGGGFSLSGEETLVHIEFERAVRFGAEFANLVKNQWFVYIGVTDYQQVGKVDATLGKFSANFGLMPVRAVQTPKPPHPPHPGNARSARVPGPISIRPARIREQARRYF